MDIAIAMENLHQYADRLDRALSKGEPHTTYNHDIFHAFAIIVAVFKYAKKEVLLLSNHLNLTVYGNPDLLKPMEDFLRDRHGSLRILVESDIVREHPVIQLTEDKSCNLSIRQIPKEEVDGYKYNFLVMDNTGFRLERDRAKSAAIAGFNDKNSAKVAANLRVIFERLGAKSQELLLQQ